ncbi:MAG: hypothetical protein ACRDG4_04645 [Chloroflexota bacterium]
MLHRRYSNMGYGLGMYLYYSTFITGFEDVIEAVLGRHAKSVSIEGVLDGGIVYNSSY